MAIAWQDNQEYVAIVKDLMENEKVQSLEKFVHHKYTNRLAHSISVSYRSYLWAKRFKLDAIATARAALLHDLFFYDSCSKDCVGGKGHNYEHPRIALKNALEITDLSDKEKDIILKHMCGATLDIPRYGESLIVTLMDKQSAVCELVEGLKRWLKASLDKKEQTIGFSE
ncbi:phosphohydrolase [Facklamia sp. P12937]|uniref:phosphohydrolase n=1 Tax=Facklamia sp. P12937 TaxID=3421949 RepID=UPI003D180686